MGSDFRTPLSWAKTALIRNMQSTAFLSRPTRRSPLERREEPALHLQQFSGGQQVQITLGPLAGMQGRLHKQALDGRWIVQLANLAPGVFLCIDARNLERCP